FDADFAIFDYGLDGQTPGANRVTFSTLQSRAGQDIATAPAVWPALRGWQNAGIDAWDNFLVFTANSLPVITVSLTNVTVPAGRAVTFNVLADGPGAISYAWYTNGILCSGATSRAFTSPPLDNRYTNVLVTASNLNGSVSNSATITVFVATLPVVTNSPAENIQPQSARLGGQVLATGGDAPDITMFYGPV